MQLQILRPVPGNRSTIGQSQVTPEPWVVFRHFLIQTSLFQTLNHPLLNSCTESGSSRGSLWREKVPCRNTQV